MYLTETRPQLPIFIAVISDIERAPLQLRSQKVVLESKVSSQFFVARRQGGAVDSVADADADADADATVTVV